MLEVNSARKAVCLLNVKYNVDPQVAVQQKLWARSE